MSLFRELVNNVGGSWVTVESVVDEESKPPPEAATLAEKYRMRGWVDLRQFVMWCPGISMLVYDE